MVKKEPGLHQTLIKSALEAVNLLETTHGNHKEPGGQASWSLCNHDAWQRVILVLISYADQRVQTHGRASPTLSKTTGGMKQSAKR